MRRLSVRIGAAVAGAVLAVGCSGVDREDTLAEAGSRDADARDEIAGGFVGILTEDEAGCVADTVLSNDEIRVGDIIDFADAPANSGPVFELYRTAFSSCVDPAVEVPVVPVEGRFREQFVQGMRGALPDLTDEQADCVLQHLADNGIGMRQLVIANYLPEQASSFNEVMASATPCLA